MKPQTAKGVKDIPPEEKILANNVTAIIKNTFELSGFAPLETPIIERYETLAAKFAAGEESDALKETFTFADQGKRKLGLRFDLTVPLARYVAMNPTLKMPFKRYEMGIVFRDGPIKLGRTRQFWQCDADIIGSSSMLAEAELLSIFERVFSQLKLLIVVKVNNRKILNGILEEAGIKNKEQAMVAIDKLDKIGKKGVEQELEQQGCTKEQIVKLFAVIKENITLRELKKLTKNKETQEGISELEELLAYLKIMKVISATFDISLVRGLAYYTGTVYEVFSKEGAITSSLGSGGRYDNMIGQFMGRSQQIPAVGISFGLVPILELLKGRSEKKSPSVIYLIPINTNEQSLPIAQQLRKEGIPTDYALGKKGVSKNLECANALGIPYVMIVGEDELKQKKVLLRDMRSGTEQLLTVKEVVRRIKNEFKEA